MKRPSRDSWLALGLLLVLVLVTIGAAIQQSAQKQGHPPLSSASSDPGGARALRLWLEALGYTIDAEPGPTFDLGDQTGCVLMLEPLAGVSAQEWEVLDAWVEDGGTLILAGDGAGARLAARHYDFQLLTLPSTALTLTAQTPLLLSPPLTGSLPVRARAYFRTSRDDFVTHLSAGAQPVLLSFDAGEGRVVLSATAFPFSNAGLKEDGNPALVLNVLPPARYGSVWFDEWHHGQRATQASPGGPGDWLRYTPAGRAMLFVAGTVFLALLLQGRPFGRPVPLPRDAARRAPLEYVTAMANLSRRAGHRTAVLGHYRQRLKRNLGRRYRLDPALPDDEYVAQLAKFAPQLDLDALRRLLARLRSGTTGERELIQLAAEAAAWLKEP